MRTVDERLRERAVQAYWPNFSFIERELTPELRADLLDLARRGYIAYRTTTSITPILIVEVTPAGKAHYFSLVHGEQP